MFSRKRKVKIDKELYDRLVEAAERAGYSSTDELIVHVLEREVAGLEEQLDDAQAEQQLRGLGYIE
jgi:hypothetical protein